MAEGGKEVATAWVSIKVATGALKETFKWLGGFVIQRFRNISTITKIAVGNIVAQVSALTAGQFSNTIQLAQRQEAAERRLAQVLRSTGHAAGFTAGQLKEMAGELQNLTTFGDEATLEAQAIIATFSEVRGEQFRRATELAQDLSAAGFGDLTGQAKALAKALQEPLVGMQALRESGVSFTAQQKETVQQMLETGRVVEAQTLILDAIEQQVGGVAKALAETDAGRFEQAMNALGDAGEEMGKQLLPVWTAVIEQFTRMVKNMIPFVNSIAHMIHDIITRFNELNEYLDKEFGERFESIFLSLRDIVLNIGPFIFDAFKNILDSIAGLFGYTVEDMFGGFIAGLDWVLDKISIFTTDFEKAWEYVKQSLYAGLLEITNWILGWGKGLVEAFMNPWGAMVSAIKNFIPIIVRAVVDMGTLVAKAFWNSMFKESKDKMDVLQTIFEVAVPGAAIGRKLGEAAKRLTKETEDGEQEAKTPKEVGDELSRGFQKVADSMNPEEREYETPEEREQAALRGELGAFEKIIAKNNVAQREAQDRASELWEQLKAERDQRRAEERDRIKEFGQGQWGIEESELPAPPPRIQRGKSAFEEMTEGLTGTLSKIMGGLMAVTDFEGFKLAEEEDRQRAEFTGLEEQFKQIQLGLFGEDEIPKEQLDAQKSANKLLESILNAMIRSSGPVMDAAQRGVKEMGEALFGREQFGEISKRADQVGQFLDFASKAGFNFGLSLGTGGVGQGLAGGREVFVMDPETGMFRKKQVAEQEKANKHLNRIDAGIEKLVNKTEGPGLVMGG